VLWLLLFSKKCCIMDKAFEKTVRFDRRHSERKEVTHKTFMLRFPKLFHATGKKRALVFVDYEHWYISLEKLHNQKPDIRGWYKELSQKYDVRDIFFFADFSNTSIRLEIPRIREVSSTIVETQNTSPHHKKDFTDFIMLDHIYQKAMTADNIDAFIIFSGDGHFSSAATFLHAKCGKEVGVYAVKNAASTVLKNSATWMIEIPEKKDPFAEIYSLILANLKSLEKASGKKKNYPTFWATVESVARKNALSKSTVAEALRKLISDQVVFQKQENISSGKSIKTVNVNWAEARKRGLSAE